jgi:hypothetical protein
MMTPNLTNIALQPPIVVGTPITTAVQQLELKEIGSIPMTQIVRRQYEGDVKVDYSAGNVGAAKTLSVFWFPTNDTTTSVANLIKSLGGNASDGKGWSRIDIAMPDPVPVDPNPRFGIYPTVLRSTAKARIVFAYTLPAALDNEVVITVTLGLRG